MQIVIIIINYIYRSLYLCLYLGIFPYIKVTILTIINTAKDRGDYYIHIYVFHGGL